MNVYTGIHSYYCGIDLHARFMYICILDSEGSVVYHKNRPCTPEAFLEAVAEFRDGLVVGVECIFCWYWIADLCEQEGIDFILGHALYMKAIHGVKTKNDRIDSLKIARLIRGGNFPVAYVYPPQMRATRDLMRRRNHFVRKRAELLGHIQNTTSQYNLPSLGTLSRPHHRRDKDIVGHFPDPVVQLMIQTDLELIDHYDPIIKRLDKQILSLAKGHDPTSLYLLKSIRGVGDVLALTMLYEIHDIGRFPSRGEFCSYARLVKGQKSSNGKNYGTTGGRIGNAHLRWAFSEASLLYLRGNTQAEKYYNRLISRHGKGKALTIIAKRLGVAVYYMLKRREPFNEHKFLTNSIMNKQKT
ncbi:IS110 family transposase [Fodinibius sp.]|uniref:IS110 family transposase n=1 Tax=Fodinibius sp. TaxID=1872440 RepID=UPI002ACECC87|nr:IS110 family transposase [Fodinibius sp.]MDZ7658012.1 IS110 family transposase [Fodinibius sp.]